MRHTTRGLRRRDDARQAVLNVVYLLVIALSAASAACSAGSEDVIEDKRCDPADPDPEKGCVSGYQCICANPQRCFCVKREQQGASTGGARVARPEDTRVAQPGDDAGANADTDARVDAFVEPPTARTHDDRHADGPGER